MTKNELFRTNNDEVGLVFDWHRKPTAEEIAKEREDEEKRRIEFEASRPREMTLEEHKAKIEEYKKLRAAADEEYNKNKKRARKR